MACKRGRYLFLRENKENTVVSYIKGVKYLGYSLYVNKGKYHRTSKVQGKDEVTAKVLTNGWRYEKRKQKPKKYIRGWAGYYHLANMKRLCQKNYEWLRQRIRMYMECLETPQDQKKGPHQKRSQGLQRTTMEILWGLS